MNSIDKLIFDALAGRRSVALAGVGTLEVKRRGAKKVSDTQIIPPQNAVVFTPDELESAVGVVSLAAAEGGMGEEEAVALYGSWLEAARREDGTIAIDGVGELTESGFVVAEPLHTILNPANEQDIVTMETEKRSTPVWVWIVIALLVVLLVLGAIWCCKKGMFECGRSKAPAVETVVVPEPDPVADSLAAAAASAATVPAATASPTPGFHVIAGAFSIESNADNFITRLKRDHPELTPVKLTNPSNGFHMVSIFQMPTRREASNKMNLYWDIDLNLWIYEQK